MSGSAENRKKQKITRPTFGTRSSGGTLVEPLDGSKFMRNLLRLNKYSSRKARSGKNQHSAFFPDIERASSTRDVVYSPLMAGAYEY
jgi:hypothetical protein